MLTDDFKASVGRLTASVDNLAARVAAGGTGGTVPDTVVAAGVAVIGAAADKLDSLLVTAPPTPVTTTAPAPATNFSDPLKP